MSHSVSVLIPCWSRRVDFAATFSLNVREMDGEVSEILIITIPDDLEFIRSVIRDVKLKKRSSLRIRVLACRTEKLPTKGRLLNVGIAQCTGLKVICLDCDIVLPRRTIASMRGSAGQGNVTYLAKLSTNRKGAETEVQVIRNIFEVALSDGRSARVERSAIYQRDNARSAPGVVCTERQHLIEVRGYNGDLAGYGWEDIDLLIRMGIKTGCAISATGEAVDRADRKNENEQGRLLSESQNYQSCLANYCLGIFDGSLEADYSEAMIEKIEE